MSKKSSDKRYPILASTVSLSARSSQLAKRGLSLIDNMLQGSDGRLDAAKADWIHDQGILLVDDEEVIRLFYPEELKEAGFTNVVVADGAGKAMEILEKLGDKITLVVTHNCVTEEGDYEAGQKLVKHLTQTYDGIIGVIFCSSLFSLADECMVLGNENVMVLDYVVKTHHLRDLVQSLRKNIPVVMEKRRRFNRDHGTK